MEKHWKCTERVSIEPWVLTGVVRQGCAENEGHRMCWRGQTLGSRTMSKRPCVACGGPPKSAPLDKRPSDLCLDPEPRDPPSTRVQLAIFEELNWKCVPLYLSKTLLSVTSPTLVFTRPCGSHSDALLVSRALLLPGFSQSYWCTFFLGTLFLLTDFGQGILLLCHIPKYIKRWSYFLLLTFQFNIHLLCFIGFFSSQKDSSISVQFLQNSNALVEIWFFLLRPVGISNYTVS